MKIQIHQVEIMPLALLNAQEKYEQLSVTLKDIEEEIRSTQALIIDGSAEQYDNNLVKPQYLFWYRPIF